MKKEKAKLVEFTRYNTIITYENGGVLSTYENKSTFKLSEFKNLDFKDTVYLDKTECHDGVIYLSPLLDMTLPHNTYKKCLHNEIMKYSPNANIGCLDYVSLDVYISINKNRGVREIQWN